jgi:hypothetical protein
VTAATAAEAPPALALVNVASVNEDAEDARGDARKEPLDFGERIATEDTEIDTSCPPVKSKAPHAQVETHLKHIWERTSARSRAATWRSDPR